VRFDMGVLGISFNAGVDMGVEGDQETMGLILIKDFDPLGVLFAVEELDIFFDQFDRGFIDTALEGDGTVAVDFPSGPGAEEIGEIFGGGA